MENKQNKTNKFNEGSAISLLVVSLLLFIIVGFGILALVPLLNEKYGNVINFPGLGGYSGEAKMKKFSSSSELKNFLEEGAANSSGMYGSTMLDSSSGQGMTFNETSKSGEIEAWGSAASPSGLPISGEMGGSDYSTTNVQVAGVDEGDIVKTDGEYIYAVSGNDVVIAKAYPADGSEITARIKFDSSISGIYLSGNKLAVYGQNYNVYENHKDILPRRRDSQFTFFKIYDISDKSNPKEERNVDFEGGYTNSRMIGNHIYFVTSSYSHCSYYDDDESPIPIILEDGKIVSGGEGRAFPNIYYFDIPYYSYNFMTVSAVDISDSGKKISNEIYLLDSSQNSMFVSKDNIYITFVRRISEEELMIEIVKEVVLPELSEKNRKRIKEIENAENYILSPQEKIAKIGMIIEAFGESLTEEEQKRFEEKIEEKAKQKYEDISKELEKTIIHKIGIDNGTLKYKTAGEVPGVVLNQFSMDEDKGYFRIATTKNRSWSSSGGWEERESYSNLYVLDEKMNTVGKVEKLAKGEKIYSVRFMQNRAYLVTFKQVDPLFVIDLSSPTNPKVLGELKIPGYSNYLHPYDETTLIGLGKDSGNWDAKLKLSLFDVSSIGDPKEIDTYILEGKRSDSIALYDHKAFLFSKDKNLLVIPASYEESGILIDDVTKNSDDEEIVVGEKKIIMPNPNKYFRGALVFYIDKKGFKLRGKIDHSDGANEDNSWGRYGRTSSVKRSLFIKEILYTLSDKYLKMNKLDGLGDMNSLILNNTEKSIPPPTWEPTPMPIDFIE